MYRVVLAKQVLNWADGGQAACGVVAVISFGPWQRLASLISISSLHFPEKSSSKATRGRPEAGVCTPVGHRPTLGCVPEHPPPPPTPSLGIGHEVAAFFSAFQRLPSYAPRVTGRGVRECHAARQSFESVHF